jgi:circadian clock protein KaiB
MTEVENAKRWALTLYVNSGSAESIRAIEAVRRLCDELGGHVDLEVVDVHGPPALGLHDQIVAVPTLIKRRPGPPRRIVGGLSDPGKLRRWLDLDSVASSSHPRQDG